MSGNYKVGSFLEMHSKSHNKATFKSDPLFKTMTLGFQIPKKISVMGNAAGKGEGK